jgi:predicted tellurium resistance membrane protein TerC
MDFSIFSETSTWISLLTLTFMEVVLGIDNIIFISITAGKLPAHQQASARRIGLLIALVFRILLLLSIKWIIGLKEPLFHILEYGVSGRNLILLAGGIFLLVKSILEIHHKVEKSHHTPKENVAESASKGSYNLIIFQIILLDIVFSFDSILTAVGLTEFVVIMIAAVILSMFIMLAFSGPVSHFINKHPTLQILALSFLILIGFTLILEGLPEGLGVHISKGYIYFAIFFSLVVETLNIRFRTKNKQH